MTIFIIIALLGSLVALCWALWPLRSLRVLKCLILSCILLGSIGLAYWTWGGWREYRTYVFQLAKQQKAEAMLASMRDPGIVIQRMKSHLVQHPRSVKGWYLLGRLYASQNQWSEAKLAFSKASELAPTDEKVIVNLAQSLLADGQKKEAKQARVLLKKLLKTDPTQPDALALLAMDAYTQKSYEKAIEYWQRLLPLLPPNSEEANAVRRAIADANAKWSR